jgi:non-heme chloroperoxidase
MPFVTVGSENGADIAIHFNDHGSGKPIVLVHGYPLDGNSWERQERVLLGEGYRCISYDRRGFGQSSQPVTGYDYDTFASDLKALLDHLALDQNVVLAGFSMGTGEVTRYLGTYGSAGVSKAALFGVIPPFLLQTEDNPKGVPGGVFDGIKQAIVADRYAYFDEFFANFYNTDVLAPERIGDAALRASFQVAAGASPYASYACVDTWLTDFRGDLPKIDVPTLVVHGTADRILPFEATAARLRDEKLALIALTDPLPRRPPYGFGFGSKTRPAPGSRFCIPHSCLTRRGRGGWAGVAGLALNARECSAARDRIAGQAVAETPGRLRRKPQVNWAAAEGARVTPARRGHWSARPRCTVVETANTRPSRRRNQLTPSTSSRYAQMPSAR